MGYMLWCKHRGLAADKHTYQTINTLISYLSLPLMLLSNYPETLSSPRPVWHFWSKFFFLCSFLFIFFPTKELWLFILWFSAQTLLPSLNWSQMKQQADSICPAPLFHFFVILTCHNSFTHRSFFSAQETWSELQASRAVYWRSGCFKSIQVYFLFLFFYSWKSPTKTLQPWKELLFE